MAEISEDDWRLITEAYRKAYPGSWPDRSMIIGEMVRLYVTSVTKPHGAARGDSPDSVIARSQTFQRATGTQDAGDATERIVADDGSSVVVVRRIAFRIASPPCDGWYDVRWSPSDAWQRVWLARVTDEDAVDPREPDVFRWVWGHDPADDPESLALDVSDPLGIEWRHAT